MDHEATAATNLKLPLQVVSPYDVNRLIRELEGIEDFVRQSTIRQPGVGVKLPHTSRLLEDFAVINKLNFLQSADRSAAGSFLTEVNQKAPTIHISFAADPSAVFVGKIILWLRTNIHPSLLLRIGLEPTIAAGCVVRTTNKQFDFSLRQHFNAKKGMLVGLIDGQMMKDIAK